MNTIFFPVFCALTACFALCDSCYENLQACPWMHRLIWIVFTQIQDWDWLRSWLMQTWCLLGRLTQLWWDRSCSILYRCEKTRVMKNETRLKTFCGRYQKNVISGEPIRTFFLSRFLTESTIRSPFAWKVDERQTVGSVIHRTCSSAAALVLLCLLSVACNQLLLLSLRRTLGWAEERALSLSQHVWLKQWRDYPWRWHISSQSV